MQYRSPNSNQLYIYYSKHSGCYTMSIVTGDNGCRYLSECVGQSLINPDTVDVPQCLLSLETMGVDTSLNVFASR